MIGFHLHWFFSAYLHLNFQNKELKIAAESCKTLASTFIYMYNNV